MGTRFRIPRRIKKIRNKLYTGNLTFEERRLLNRCLIIPPLRWKGVRKGNIHVAMGDTTTARRRERWNRMQERYSKG